MDTVHPVYIMPQKVIPMAQKVIPMAQKVIPMAQKVIPMAQKVIPMKCRSAHGAPRRNPTMSQTGWQETVL
jgi:hypothetical protein